MILEKGEYSFNFDGVRWIPAVAGLLVVWLVYTMGAGAPFTFDDEPSLTGNYLAHFSPAALDHWRVASDSSGSGSLRRPVTMFTFYLNFALSGEYSPRAIKATNALIHCVIAALLYFLFIKVLRVAAPTPRNACHRKLNWMAALAAGAWLLHPLHVSTVLYSVQRMAQLSTLFVVLGLLLFVTLRTRWSRRGATVAEVVAGGLWLLLIGLLAVFSKENGILLWWLIPVCEVCLFRGSWAGSERKWLQWLGWIAFVAPLLLIAAVFWWQPDMFTSGYLQRNFTMEERVLTQARLLWRYAGWIVWPNIFDMGFQHDDIPISKGLLAPVTTLISVAGLLGVLALGFLLRRRVPLLLFAVLFFLVGHSLESGFLALEMVFEHRNYLPSIGICLLLGSLLLQVLNRIDASRRVWAVAFLGLVLMSLLAARVHTWSNDLRLAQSNLARHPDSVRSNYYYAHTLLRYYSGQDVLGLTPEQANDYLLKGRYYYEVMHQLDKQDIAALVMLYYLDKAYFRALDETTDWLGALIAAFDGKVLKQSDRNALAVLAECMGDGSCETSESEMNAIYSALKANYPNGLDAALFKYFYYLASNATPQLKLQMLQEIQSIRPGLIDLNFSRVAELGRLKAHAEIFDTLLEWTAADPDRRYLPALKQLFEGGASE
ncbi:hypothetical protein [Parahaliea aestuarii]|uniref:Tetratricopeptide repeat protein n=1 Tax=Parahaliea aestuarii TaxID=1852021 RepID=A0A5C9A2H2_9GAMM|nr:hypothetical protein [Parahaliea aestuarii]TXS94958.1 hypothetical protein FVW59_03390 [Parahaliea aestuarii]